MGKDTLYDITIESPVQVTREEYVDVGSGDNIVGNIKRAFHGGTDFEIWTAASEGTQLVEDTDYELINKDLNYTRRAGSDVFTGFKILNATYQTGSIFINYKILGSYPTAELIQNISDQIIEDIENGSISVANAVTTDGINETGADEGILKTKILQIGDWDMDSNAWIEVPHGLTYSKIRSVTALIRNDNGSSFYDLSRVNPAVGTTSDGIRIDSINIHLQRIAGGAFDSTDFDTPSGYNRGWIVIGYIL